MDTTYRSHDWEVNILGNFFWCYCFTEDQAHPETYNSSYDNACP